MSFKSKEIREIMPVDLDKVDQYIEPMREDLNDFDLKNFYKAIV